MKAIKCELCGSNNLVKRDGEYVCEYCGTKYSIEEAKKLMVEGKVDVSGSTVKLDQSEELKKLYEIARRAKDDGNSENAQKYYEMILLKDASSWEANFYTVYYQSMNCKIAGIQSAAIRISNCEDTIIDLIKENVENAKERKEAVIEIKDKLLEISNMLYSAAMNHYNGISYQIQGSYTQELIDNCFAARNIVYNYGDYIAKMMGDKYILEVSVPCWKMGIIQHNQLLPKLVNKEMNREKIEHYTKKIIKYDATYEKPEEPEDPSSATGSCYVATCVYGSYDCPEVWTLRRFRDYKLSESWYGRAFIHTYYTISPTIVKWFGDTTWFKKLWKGKLDKMVEKLQEEGFEDTPYKDREW